jgi:hypothetical protein
MRENLSAFTAPPKIMIIVAFCLILNFAAGKVRLRREALPLDPAKASRLARELFNFELRCGQSPSATKNFSFLDFLARFPLPSASVTCLRDERSGALLSLRAGAPFGWQLALVIAIAFVLSVGRDAFGAPSSLVVPPR